MYGSIMRARVRTGQRETLTRHLERWVTETPPKGWLSSELAWEDRDPDRVIMIVHFADKTSYQVNAGAPETDGRYREMLQFLEGPPDWIDVHYATQVGQPPGR